MIDLINAVLTIAVLVLTCLWFKRPKQNLPPYPTRPLPLLGHLLTLEDNPRSQFKTWREELGDIFSLQMGSELLVIISGYDLIKELFLKRAGEFSDRPKLAFDQVNPLPEKGITFSKGKSWKEHRTVALHILRDFGMGKNILAGRIQEEVTHFLDLLSESCGQPSDVRVATYVSTANVISSIVLGHRFDYKDERYQDMIARFSKSVSADNFNSPVNFFPCLRHLPGDFFHVKEMKKAVKDLFKFIHSFVQEKGYIEYDENNIDNFIAAYVKEMTLKKSRGKLTFLSDEGLMKVVYDLFTAGMETTSATINWCLLYVLNYPDVQAKIYQEMKEKIGSDRRPCIQDKQSLVYLTAVIKETQRLSSIVPNSVTHTSLHDVTVRGYTIPKGTYISPNLDSVLHDPKIWGNDVMEFKPERFIDQDGKLKTPEEFIPFSIGRRVCLGESLAVMELFLYLSSIFHRFEILPATPGSPPPIKYKFGIIAVPLAFQLRAVERRWEHAV
ncbi:cytochrome P450 2C3-like [Physella acuta]|uniref:cytochrome P450 2C3-like n=1 Tax=Physella acuta TaxID=109671 RepID=UPI0027DE6F3B|nr:cytochrome P450 2C3-like [Physella acuta]